MKYDLGLSAFSAFFKISLFRFATKISKKVKKTLGQRLQKITRFMETGGAYSDLPCHGPDIFNVGLRIEISFCLHQAMYE